MENFNIVNNHFGQADVVMTMDSENKEQQWLKPEDVAKQLGVSARTILRLLEKGELSGYKIGRHFRFKQEDVDEYLKSSRINRKTDTEQI